MCCIDFVCVGYTTSMKNRWGKIDDRVMENKIEIGLRFSIYLLFKMLMDF